MTEALGLGLGPSQGGFAMAVDSDVATSDDTAPRRTSRSDNGFGRVVGVLVIWHLVLAVLSAIGFIAALTPSAEGLPGPIRSIVVGGTAAGIVANALAVVWLRRRLDRGRTVAIGINYLTFLAFTSALLSLLDVFTGIDDFADGFENGIWFLLIPLVGWGWIILVNRYESLASAAWLKQAGLVIVVVGLVAFFLKVGLIDGVGHMLGELAAPWPVLSVIAIVLTGVALRELWGSQARNYFGTTGTRQEQIEGFLFLSPNLLGFLFFFAGPLVFSFIISFWDWDALGDKSFIGLSNYIDLFSLDLAFMDSGTEPASNALKSNYAELWRFDLFGQNIMVSAIDKEFWQSLRNILFFLVLAVPLSIVPALLLSNLLNAKLPGVKVFRAIFFIPSIAGVIGISLIWRQLFNATVGWLNYLLTEALPGDTQIQWLSDQDTALLSIVIVFAWMTFGFNTVLFLAGLQGIPPSLYEAAKLDGANAWQRFRYITVPTLRPTTFFVMAMTTIQAIQLFDIVFVLVNPPEGPNNSTLTPVLYLYQQGFQNFSQGYASAVAWVLFALIFGLTLVQFRRNQAAEEGAFA